MMEETARSNNGGRIPPQDIVAEKSLLGAAMISENVISEVLSIVRPLDFYDKRHQIIYETMLNLYDRHKPIDLLTLTSELRAVR